MNVQTQKILRDLWVNKSRSLLITLAVAIGVAAFGLMISGRIVLEENLRDVYAATKPAHAILSLSPFDQTLLTDVRAMDNVVAAQAYRADLARLKTGPDSWLGFEIQTIPDFDNIAVNKITAEGELSNPPLNSIFLERSLKNVIDIGDTVTIRLLNGNEHTLTVAGFVNDLSRLPAEISLAGIGYITPETANELELEPEYNQLLIRYADGSTRTEVEKLTTTVTEAIEEDEYIVFNANVPVPDTYILGDNMTSVLFILNSLGFLTLILSAFLVTSVMSAMMSQQIPQIGILKSLGAHVGQTMSIYFREVLLFGIFALILAIPMGLVGAYFLADGLASSMNFDVPNFYLPTQTLILQAISALLAPLLAALIPIISGSRITIREALSNYTPDSASNALSLGEIPQIANLSVRNTFRRKSRLALTFAALLLAGSMFISIIGIREEMRQASIEMQKEANYDLDVDLARPYSQSTLEETALRVKGVEEVETWAVDTGRLIFNKDRLSGSIILYGIPQGTTMTQPAVINGTWLSKPKSIFVNNDFLLLSPDLKVGSVITLNIGGKEEEWTIVGSTGRGFIPIAYVYYDDLTKVTGLDGFASRLVVRTDKSDSAFQTSAQSDVLSHLAAEDIDVVNSSTTTERNETSLEQMDTLIILLMAMVILIAIVGGLGLAITMSLNVMERTREIGILRSLGAQNGVVRRVVMIEGLVIGVISWVISIPCSVPLSIFLGNSLGLSLLARPLDYIFSVPAMLIWLALTVVIAIIASILPAQSAARLTIRDALVYE
ncbi:MAG TPA: FtsX-like permease family protein [Anaerolineales bacterium]|nr:FtsX-like permease family protein [Anaerolineales bacterium]